MSNIISFFTTPIYFSDVAETVGKICTHELTIFALGVVVLVGIPLFGK